MKGIKADTDYIPLRTDPYAEHVEFPFAKGDITSNGVQYSALVTTSSSAYTEVESATIEPPIESIDEGIIEIQFSLTGSFQSSSTLKDVLF